MTRKRQALAGILILVLALAALIAAVTAESGGEPAPATPTDLETEIRKELEAADVRARLENEFLTENALKAENGEYVFRIALERANSENTYFFLFSEESIQARVIREDGSGDTGLSAVEQELTEPWKYAYELKGYPGGNDTLLIRLKAGQGSRFRLLIQTESAYQNSQNPPDPDPQHDPDPSPEPTEEPAPFIPRGGGGRSQPHAKDNRPIRPDYDLVDLKLREGEADSPMSRLKMGDEELDLELEQDGTEAGGFRKRLIRWETPSEDDETEAPDTLVLEAEANPEGTDRWTLNGAVLRRLHKSGILHLVLRDGERLAVMDTEGILAGWAYDELKSKGTASRRFEYRMERQGDREASWQLTVEDKTYALSGEEQEGIHLTRVTEAPAEALEAPFEELARQEDRENGGQS